MYNEAVKMAKDNFTILPLRSENIQKAALLSCYYKKLDSSIHTKQISFCDCLNAEQILKYEGRLFLITTDMHDYPITVFDINQVISVEDGKRTLVVAFITYNEKKMREAEKKFDQCRPVKT